MNSSENDSASQLSKKTDASPPANISHQNNPPIHTMGDDLAVLRTTHNEARTIAGFAVKVDNLRHRAPKVESVSASTTNIVAKGAKEPLLPLPAKQKKGITLPGGKDKNPINRRKRATTLLVILAVIVAAAFGWGLLIVAIIRPQSGEQQKVHTNISSLIPHTILATVQYRPTTQAQREQLLTLWQIAAAPSIKSLLAGDPRLLLTDTQLTEWYYVLLPSQSLPFLLLPQRDTPSTLLDQFNGQVHMIQQDGWYIIHAEDTAPYTSALEQGTIAEREREIENSFGGVTDKSNSALMRVTIHPALLAELHKALIGTGSKMGQLRHMVLDIQSATPSRTLRVEGEAYGITNAENTYGNLQLLKYVPADAIFAASGANFYHDMEYAIAKALIPNAEKLTQPAPRELISQLASPYILYKRIGADNVEDLGLIISLPSGFAPERLRGNFTLEAALPSLVQLLIGDRNIAPRAFTVTVYRDVPVRYANITDNTVALDYAVTQDHLILTTSQEGMHAALDTVTGNAISLNNAALWLASKDAWSIIPKFYNLVIGTISHQPLMQLLPARGQEITIALTTQSLENTTQITGVVILEPSEHQSSPITR